jgi:hypothetical protein
MLEDYRWDITSGFGESETMDAQMRELQDVSEPMMMMDRADSCPVCGSDGDLESALIRVKGGTLGYYAGLIYHCPSCGTAWPLCSDEGKTPIEDWIEFNEFYEGLE